MPRSAFEALAFCRNVEHAHPRPPERYTQCKRARPALAAAVAHAVLAAPAKGRAGPPPGAHGTRGARSYGGGERADSMRYVQFCFSYLKPLAGSAVLCDTAMQRQPVTESTGKPDAIRATSKMSLISSISMRSVSDIKLIRTDTTLDLSQKAEKVCFSWTSHFYLNSLCF